MSGAGKSAAPETIIAEIEGLVGTGIREITLLGQNVNSYGVKEKLTSFPNCWPWSTRSMVGAHPFCHSHPKDLSDALIASLEALKIMQSHSFARAIRFKQNVKK
ncbi:MAG: hypothetical protein R2874_00895 [Desulfobacterales bacterium]